VLSYRHEFHAGNVADLLKHSVLSLIIEYLKQKPAPVRYIDTHAGAGLYSITSAMAEKTGEYQRGVGSLSLANFPAQLAAYQSVIAAFAPDKHYPGSPLLAARLLRAQDELRLFELHSSEYPRLHDLLARDRRVRIVQTDGYASVNALLPVRHARALVLIDPSYEVKSDYEAVVECLRQGYARMPNAVFAIWYPVINNPALAGMLKKLAAIPERNVWRFELSAFDTGVEAGMTATGMFVVSPPWTLAQDLDTAFQAICSCLPFDHSHFSVECLKE